MKYFMREVDDEHIQSFLQLMECVPNERKSHELSKVSTTIRDLFDFNSRAYKNALKIKKGNFSLCHSYLDHKQDDFNDEVYDYINQKQCITISWVERVPASLVTGMKSCRHTWL